MLLSNYQHLCLLSTDGHAPPGICTVQYMDHTLQLPPGLSYKGQVVYIQYVLDTGTSWDLVSIRQEYSSLGGVVDVKASPKYLSCLSQDLVHEAIEQKAYRTQPCLTLVFASNSFDIPPAVLTWHLMPVCSSSTICASCWGTLYSFGMAIKACRFTESCTLVKPTKQQWSPVFCCSLCHLLYDPQLVHSAHPFLNPYWASIS